MYSIFRLFRTPNSNATFPPKASAPQSSGTAQGSSRSPAVSGVKPKEEKLAGYLMARSAMNRKVEGSALKNLRAGHETVQQAGDLLPLGRANVIPDIEKAKGEHILLRKNAADKLADALLDDHEARGGDVTDIEIYGAAGASAQHAKTGTCGCHAANILTLHGAKLADMGDERTVVSYVEHNTVDHVWSEMHPKGVTADGTPILHGEDVIMDGWGKEKVAILREDSQFARLDKTGRADHLQHDEPLNHVTGPEALNTLEKFKTQIANSPFLQGVFNSEYKRLVAGNFDVPKEDLWNDTSVFHADFRGQAGKALRKNAYQIKSAALTEIQAVGVARSLGSNVRGAIAEAPGIIASAKDMFPNPEMK